MIIGFCGSGNMAAAMARGWRGAVERMLFTDSGSGKAARLAAELGGEALASNSELAERADVLVLAVKPAALERVAAELARATPVISVLGATPLQRVAAALPATPGHQGDAKCRQRGSPRRAVHRRPRSRRAGGAPGDSRAGYRAARRRVRRGDRAHGLRARPTSRSRSRRWPRREPPPALMGSWRASWWSRRRRHRRAASAAPSTRGARGGRLARGQHRGRPAGA